MGIDTAYWQGIVPWPACVAAGFQWAWIKVCQGLGAADGHFHQNWETSRGLLPRGGYLYFTDDDPVAQADHVASLIDATGDRGEVPLMVDFEKPDTRYRGKVLLDRLRACLARLGELGFRVVLYTGRYYWRQFVGDDVDASDIVAAYPLVHAEYPPMVLRDRLACGTAEIDLAAPHPPAPFVRAGVEPLVHQWDGDKGCLLPNGVDVDVDAFLGDEDAWLDFVGAPRQVGPAEGPRWGGDNPGSLATDAQGGVS
jgi:GH25 family lysozyme M1 (1,4-beta-N-acetylmuramidase)